MPAPSHRRSPFVADDERTIYEVSPFRPDLAAPPMYSELAGLGRQELNLSQMGAGSGFGSWLSDLLPANTIIGKALRGDISGAASGAVKLVAGAGGAAKPAAPALPPPSAGIFSPGGLVERYQTPLLLGVAGLAAYFLFSRRRSR